MAACFLLFGTAVLSAAGLACRFGWVTELATVQVCQAPVLHQNRAEDMLVSCTLRRRGRACFWLVPRNLLRAPTATDIHATGPFLSCGPVACRDRIVVSMLHCIRSNPGSKMRRGRLLSPSWDRCFVSCRASLQVRLGD